MTRRWDRSHRDSQGPGPEVVGVDQASSSDEAVAEGVLPLACKGVREAVLDLSKSGGGAGRHGTELACNQTAACTSDYCKCTAQASSITLRSERPLLTLATGSSLACRSNAHRAALGHLPGAETGQAKLSILHARWRSTRGRRNNLPFSSQLLGRTPKRVKPGMEEEALQRAAK